MLKKKKIFHVSVCGVGVLNFGVHLDRSLHKRFFFFFAKRILMPTFNIILLLQQYERQSCFDLPDKFLQLWFSVEHFQK